MALIARNLDTGVSGRRSGRGRRYARDAGGRAAVARRARAGRRAVDRAEPRRPHVLDAVSRLTWSRSTSAAWSSIASSNLKPWRIRLPRRGTAGVLELPAGTLDASGHARRPSDRICTGASRESRMTPVAVAESPVTAVGAHAAAAADHDRRDRAASATRWRSCC